MEKKIKKLSLNKETLVSLQEKQMKSLIGGNALISDGTTSSYTCAPAGGSCTPVPVSTDSCVTCPKTEAVEAEAVSCCKKTCNA